MVHTRRPCFVVVEVALRVSLARPPPVRHQSQQRCTFSGSWHRSVSMCRSRRYCWLVVATNKGGYHVVRDNQIELIELMLVRLD
uniref:Putative secreted protein n=1 Tax=Anopheles darlingi TaxID=43151 RepID=A0A2M4DHR1_ANODA